MDINTKIAIYVAVVVGASPAGFAKEEGTHREQAGAAAASSRMPVEPYGTSTEVQQCVARGEGALHGRNILGSRDTAAYIQDLGNLDEMGLTEYDVMVGRCRNKLFQRYIQMRGR